MLKNFYLGAADDKYVNSVKKKNQKAFATLNYKNTGLFPIRQDFERNAVPLPFRVTPDTLLNLAIKVIESSPLPEVYSWNTGNVCRWLEEYGYPQYVNTFCVNFINGRRLLLLDASALSAMNIKDFDHVRHITYGIRTLFHFELAKFGRSIALPPELYLELYKLIHVKNGTKYETMTPSQLWRRMQLIQEQSAALTRNHWDILKNWLKLQPEIAEPVIVSGGKTFDILKHYTVKTSTKKIEPSLVDNNPCKCIPPCQCFWTHRQTRSPWRLKCLPKTTTSSSGNKNDIVLSVLHQQFPERYSLHIIRSSTNFDCNDIDNL